VLLVDGHLNSEIVGQTAERIAELAGIEVPTGTKVLIGEVEDVSEAEPFAHEKLSPTLAMYRARDFKDALDKAEKLVIMGGIGHTSALYTNQDVRALVAQRGGGGWHHKRAATRGLSRHEVARAVYRRYQEVHNWWFREIGKVYAHSPDWLLLRKIDLWSQAFDEIRDRLLGHNGFEDDGPMKPFEAEPLVDGFRAELEQALPYEQAEADMYRKRGSG